MTRSLALSLLLVAPAAHAADILEIKGATASSYYTESGNYGADRAIDGKQGTAWVEGDPGSGNGAYLELDLGGEKKVSAIRIWGGDWTSWDMWNRANRPKEIELKFSDGSTQVITLKDEKHAQEFAIEGGAKATSSVRVRLKGTYSGSTWLDTGISEIQLLGDAAGEGPVRGTATASSTAPEDGDGNYDASNAVDGLIDSMWCEGDKDGDGTGEWLEVDFGSDTTVSGITLLNGIGSSMSLWMKANQATELQLTFDGGTTHTVAIERPSFRPTAYAFPATTSRKVKISAVSIKKGREYNDWCLSEVFFTR